MYLLLSTNNDNPHTLLMLLDHVHDKVWSSKNLEKVAMASNFAIVHRKSEGKSIELSITKTFPEGSSLPWNKYVMSFYPVTYFMTAMLYLSVRFLRNIILKIFLT